MTDETSLVSHLLLNSSCNSDQKFRQGSLCSQRAVAHPPEGGWSELPWVFPRKRARRNLGMPWTAAHTTNGKNTFVPPQAFMESTSRRETTNYETLLIVLDFPQVPVLLTSNGYGTAIARLSNVNLCCVVRLSLSPLAGNLSVVRKKILVFSSALGSKKNCFYRCGLII